jgi:RNA polymerase sigma-70 factor (ECF subfamily)
VQPPADNTDELLARRILGAAPARDAAAEAELYGRLAPRVRLYGLKHLRNAQAAADLVQDVLLLTLEKLRAREIREPERIASFVLGACRQTVIDQRRGRQRRERLLNIYADDLPLADAAPAPPLDLDRLQHCLNHLPARERAVVMMTFYDDAPAAAVASELGVSATHVRVIRHRGIEHLRECVNGAGGAA